MTIFVTWQLIVTLDSIRNSCDVFIVNQIKSTTYMQLLALVQLVIGSQKLLGGFLGLRDLENSCVWSKTVFPTSVFSLLAAKWSTFMKTEVKWWFTSSSHTGFIQSVQEGFNYGTLKTLLWIGGVHKLADYCHRKNKPVRLYLGHWHRWWRGELREDTFPSEERAG